MDRVLEFLKTTLIRGALFLVPLILTLVLLREAIGLLARLLKPIAQMLPGESLAGIALAEILAALTLIAIGFAAGLFARTAFGSRLSDRVERLVLRKMPGYTLLKSVAQGKLGVEVEGTVEVGLIRFGSARQLVFIMARHPDGLLTVFAPSAPSPTAGALYFMAEHEVQRVDIPVAEAIDCLTQLGNGSHSLLEHLNRYIPRERS